MKKIKLSHKIIQLYNLFPTSEQEVDLFEKSIELKELPINWDSPETILKNGIQESSILFTQFEESSTQTYQLAAREGQALSQEDIEKLRIDRENHTKKL